MRSRLNGVSPPASVGRLTGTSSLISLAFVLGLTRRLDVSPIRPRLARIRSCLDFGDVPTSRCGPSGPQIAYVFYVYCIASISYPTHRYTGFTTDLRQRIADHNAGTTASTSAHRPWRLKGYIAFDTKWAALAFESYLKTGSGHAFRKKRLW